LNIKNMIICNICFAEGNIVPMDAKDGFFQCPECENESWPDREGKFVDAWTKKNDEIGSLMQDMAASHKPREIKPSGPPALGSGSKNRSRKADRMKKDSLATLNRKLYYQV
jgi:hypothetical protein